MWLYRKVRPLLSTKRNAGFLLFSAAIAVVGVPGVVSAEAETIARYPFDPACPWGRLSNGKGMIHRCISQSEAESLLAKPDAPSPVVSLRADSGKIVSEQTEKAKTKLAPEYSLKIGPIVADNGDISIGRLHKPGDRYRQCIDSHGGMQTNSGKVVVKFLVRGEKMRAEGVSVESVNGVSQEAARCIAEVVDRRKVGAPSEPITGARLTFQLKTVPAAKKAD